MKKKLISQGPKGRESYTVTLPKEWILENELNKTKSVEMEIVGNKILLSTDKKEESFILDTKKYSQSIRRIIPHLYRKGISKIEIKTSEDKLIEEIYKILQQQLIGYEITEHIGDKIIIEYIIKEDESSFKTTLRRIFLLIEDFPNNKSKLKIKNLEKNIQRLINYCQRILLKKGYSSPTKMPLYFLLLDRLDKITDELSELLILEFSREQSITLKKITNYLQNANQLFYEFNPEEFDNLAHGAYLFVKKLRINDKKNSRDVYLYNIMRNISSLYGTIFSLKFQ